MFDSGQVYINGVDFTQKVSDPKALSWSKTKGARGDCNLPLQLFSDDSYSPAYYDLIEIYDPPVGMAGAERVWVGLVNDFDVEFQDNDGLRTATLQGVTLHAMFDTQGCPQVDFTATNASSIFGYLFAAGTYKYSVILGTVDAGASITRTYDPKTTLASAFSQLATDSNGYWDIDPRPSSPTVIFIVDSVPMAPFTLHDDNIVFGSNKYRENGSDFRGTQIIQGPPGVTAPKAASFVGDGTTVDFNLPTLPNQVISASYVVGGTQATAVGTYTSNPSPGDTFTAGGLVYSYVATLNNTVARQVLIGGSIAATGANARDAVNNNPTTRGSAFSSPTAINPNLTASFDGVDTLTLTANQQGEAGDGIPVSKTGTAFSWATSATTGGSNGEFFGLVIDIAGLRGAGLYWRPGFAAVTTPEPPPLGSVLTVMYADSMANFATVQNNAATSLGIGNAQQIMTARNLSEYEQMIQQAGAVLDGRSIIPAEYRFDSDDAGYFTGDGLDVGLTQPPQLTAKVNGKPWIIQDVSAQWIEGMENVTREGYGHFRYSVHCVDTKVFTTTQDTLQRLVDNPLKSLPGSTQQPTTTDANAPSVKIIYWDGPIVSDSTVKDDAFPHITIATPIYSESPLSYLVGKGVEVLAVLSVAITADLTVRFNKISNGSPVVTDTWTVTIPNGTPVDEVVSTDISSIEFFHGDVITADVIASDGQKSTAAPWAIATFQIVWAA